MNKNKEKQEKKGLSFLQHTTISIMLLKESIKDMIRKILPGNK